MPSATLSFAVGLLALISQLASVAAAPEPVTWYLAPTVTAPPAAPLATSSALSSQADPKTLSSSSSSTATSSAATRFSTVWYKAEPTTSAPPSSSTPVASSPAPASSSPNAPVYTGPLSYNGSPYILLKGYVPYPGDWAEGFPWIYAGAIACPNSTLPADFKALPPKNRTMQGISLNEDFYNKHQGLRKYCGKQVELLNPANPSGPPFVYTVTRGCPSAFCHGEGVSINMRQLSPLDRKGFAKEEDRAAFITAVSKGKAEVRFRFL